MNMYLIGAVIALVVVVCYALYRSSLGDISKLIILPSFLILMSVLGGYYYYMLGAPINYAPQGEWNYIHHQPKNDVIELWVEQDKGSRLYIIPNSSINREELEKMQEGVQQGIPQVGEIVQDQNRGDNGDGMVVHLPPLPNPDKGAL